MPNAGLRYYLPPVTWAIIIMIVSSIPHLGVPPVGITLVDKIAHFGEYFVLGFLVANAAWRSGRRPRAILMTTSSICALYGIVDELHQHFIPGRTTDPFDAVADILGASVAAGVYIWWRTSHPRSSTEPGRPGGVK